MIGIRVLACLFLVVALSTSAQQDSNVGVLSKEANAAYEAKNWERAAKLYEELSKEMTTPPTRVWLRLGAAMHSSGDTRRLWRPSRKPARVGQGFLANMARQPCMSH